MKECPVCLRCFPDHVNHCPSDGDHLRFFITGDTVLDGRYQLEKRLGQGGMGAVFKARHIFLKTQHAIKIILPDLVGNDPSLVTRFRQEAMAAAAIRHPNIVSVTDFGVVNATTPFLVMEFIEGRSLHDLLAEEGRLEPPRALEILTGVAAGLGAAHQQGIVHRDLKPLNIMLKHGAENPSDGLKLLDFGLAKIKSGEVLGSFVAAQTTGLMGSPFYMAPEQWGDEEPDRRADIYSLGVIFYQMLAGEVPFKGSSVPSIMKKHLTNPPPSLAEKGIHVSPRIEAAVRHALEKEPEMRPATVEDFISELRAAIMAEPTPADVSQPRDGGGSVGMRTVSITTPPETMLPSNAAGGASAAGADNSGASRTPPTTLREAGATDELAAAAGRPDPRSTIGGQPPAGMSTQYLDAESVMPPVGETSHQLSAQPTSYQGTHEEGEQSSTVARDGRGDAVDGGGAVVVGAESVLMDEATRLSTGQRSDETAFEDATKMLASDGEAAADASPRRVNKHQAFVVNVPQSEAAARAAAAAGGGKSGSRILLIAVLLVALVGVGGGLAYYLSTRDARTSPTTTRTNNAATTNGASVPPAEATKPDLLALPGGAFQVGRDDVPAFNDSYTAAHLQHMYIQWPAHAVAIPPFAIDRTEVTNAEYAEFVAATGYPPPPDWGGIQPRAGQERWPVRNVSLEDTRRFAVWRSRRDGVEYRLPTEEEWEYAARGGDAARLYPWGGEWTDGRANLDSQALKPVGSFSEGRTPQGVDDMIGNVWEWTSTEASIYKGNKRMRLLPEDAGKMVIRGGSHESSARGDHLITATTRRFISKETRDPLVGFRLVRAGS